MSTLDTYDAWLAAERASPNREEDANGYLRPVSPDKYLPGGPSKTLLRRVRSSLRQYGIAPSIRQERLWRQCWDWAYHVARSYKWGTAKLAWPSPNEIASQYVTLVLIEMKEASALRLPFRAFEPECVPDHLAERLRAYSAALPDAPAREERPAIADKG